MNATGQNFKRRERVLIPILSAGYAPESATVVRADRMPGWWIVRYDSDGAWLCVHESRIQRLPT